VENNGGRDTESIYRVQTLVAEVITHQKSSYQCPMLAEDGGPNAMFFTCPFCDEATALEFLQDVRLLWCKEQCNTCGGDMMWSVDKVFLKDIVGNVEGGMVGPGALIPGLSSTDHGSIIAILLISKFYLLCTSWAAYLLSEFNMNFISEHILLLTGSLPPGTASNNSDHLWVRDWC